MNVEGGQTESPVSKEAETLKTRVDELAEATKVLCDRLQPIARPRVPEKETQDAQAASSTDCDLEQRILVSRAGIECLTNVVRDMTARLAI